MDEPVKVRDMAQTCTQVALLVRCLALCVERGWQAH